jgi:UDP-2,3-diacylglucosamine pyrophosphatase LpxH
MKKNKKREIEILVLSDIHLGTYGCKAKELLKYLKSVKPTTVILNGDIIDMWQFSKRYWPKSHMQVIHKLVKWMSKGVKVYYITGNHDEMIRKFAGFEMGNFTIDNKLIMDIDGKKTWIFHGDIFDVTMKHSKWLTRLGAYGYDALILINTFCNWLSVKMGKGKISLSKKVKNSVKKAVKFINDFEKTTAEIAISNGYDFVLCGHIHQPEMRTISTDQGSVQYLNSGDWIENLTALEYNQGKWELYHYKESDYEVHSQEADLDEDENDQLVMMSNTEIFNKMLVDFQFSKNTIHVR